MAGNIGIVGLSVKLLNKSPFGAQPRQETAYYFTQDNFKSMLEQQNCFPLPPPINGVRLKEIPVCHDVYLNDYDGRALEDKGKYQAETFYTEMGKTSGDEVQSTDINYLRSLLQKSTTKSELKRQISDIVSQYDDISDKNSSEAKKLKSQMDSLAAKISAEETAEKNLTITNASRLAKTSSSKPTKQVTQSNSDLANEFYTFRTCDGLFLHNSKNPRSARFDAPPTSSDITWSYGFVMDVWGCPGTLSIPWMSTSPKDDSTLINWGCKMEVALAQNQAFRTMFYSADRDPNVLRNAEPASRSQEYSFLNNEMSTSIYFAIKFGKKFLLVLENNKNPILWDIEAKTAISEQTKLSNTLFDKNQRYVTVTIEPVRGQLLISSNAFADWVVNIDQPLEGQPVTLFGGNVQGGFALAECRYEHSGFFTTPGTSFDVVEGGGIAADMPACDTSLKGTGEIQQDKSYPKTTIDLGDSRVHMVDAESINGQDFISIVEQMYGNFSDRKNSAQMNRKIQIDTYVDANRSQSAVGNYGELIKKVYINDVYLDSSDVTQGNGYVATDGRSPYIWMMRCEMPERLGDPPSEVEEICQDVLSVDLQWNSTSYNELIQNGSIRILNYPNRGKDYLQYTNRAIYLKIYAWWDNGIGDPDKKAIFEGLTTGHEIEKKAETEVIVFKIEDYMSALQGCKFNLCPFYDGMKATLAVRDICKQIGLPDNKIYTDGKQVANGDKLIANLDDDFGLPFSNPFEEPQYRFKNGTSLKEGILAIAKKDFKTIYFDQDGRFHYDTMPGGIYLNRAMKVVATFFTNPSDDPSSDEKQKQRNQVWNSVTYNRLVNDVYNSISMGTVDRANNARLYAGLTYKAGISRPSAEGYLGYSKRLYLEDAAIGDPAALYKYLDNIRRRIFIPPLTVRFETYGRGGLKPLDVIELNNQKMRIMNISMKISAQENLFWMNIEGEWQFKAEKDDNGAINPVNV